MRNNAKRRRMPWGQIIVQWLHVFFAICWFGGTLFLLAVVSPSLQSCDPSVAVQVGEQIGKRTERFLAPAGALTIIFGLLNATIFGPVRSWSFFEGSAYGTTLLIAIVLAIIIAVLGAVTGRVGNSIARASVADRTKLLRRITLLAGLSVIGFIFALTCMVLMRYGL